MCIGQVILIVGRLFRFLVVTEFALSELSPHQAISNPFEQWHGNFLVSTGLDFIGLLVVFDSINGSLCAFWLPGQRWLLAGTIHILDSAVGYLVWTSTLNR